MSPTKDKMDAIVSSISSVPPAVPPSSCPTRITAIVNTGDDRDFFGLKLNTWTFGLELSL